MSLKRFKEWSDVIAHVRDHEPLFYKGPHMSSSVEVDAAVRPKGKLRIFLARVDIHARDLTIGEDDIRRLYYNEIENYVVLRHKETGKVFFTMNTGYERLSEYYSFIAYTTTREQAQALVREKS